MMMKYVAPTIFIVTFILFGSHELIAAPITFNTVLPVARDEKLVQVQTKLKSSTDESKSLSFRR